MSPASAELQRKLEQLQGELSSRESTPHFARTSVALFIAMIVAGAAGKVGWDAINRGGIVISGIVAGLALGLIVYSVVQYLIGKRILRGELSRFEELQAIRAQLHLDDPSSLLPSR